MRLRGQFAWRLAGRQYFIKPDVFRLRSALVRCLHEGPHHESPGAEVKVIDFSNDEVQEHDLADKSLDSFLANNTRHVSSACRWIFVNGLDADMIRSLGRHQTLHKLALDDVLHPGSRTKVDWYDGHCCIILTAQTLAAKEVSHPFSGSSAAARFHRHSAHRLQSLQKDLTASDDDRGAAASSSSSLTSPDVLTEQVSMFLTADNTVISIFESQGQQVFEQVMARLQAHGTIVRSSDDASMLVYALLDAIVDLSIPVVKSYDAAIRALELSILLDPKTSQSREVYALRSELAQLESITKPMSGLINMLREHDITPSGQSLTGEKNLRPQKPSATSRKLISPLARTYLADVQDQVLVLIDKLHTATRTTEDLTSLIFNIITVKQNESIRQLTLVTILFLPLTFLTGYFGMNFEEFPMVKSHSDAYFWYLATPVVAATSLLFVISGARARMMWRWVRRPFGRRR